jgi:hypothetical protein
MRLTITLTEEDISRAITEHLRLQGYDVNSIGFHHETDERSGRSFYTAEAMVTVPDL